MAGSVAAPLETRFVALRGIDPAVVAAWRDLADRALEPNPFFEPEFLLAAAKLYPATELLTVSRGARLIAAMPVRRVGRWRKIPARTLWIWRHTDAYLGTPLVDRDEPRAALGALLDWAVGDRGSGLVAFEWLGTGGPVEAALHAALEERGLESLVYEEFDRAALDRREAADYLRAKVSKSRARELRRLRRQLTELLRENLVTANRAGDPDAVEGFLRAEASGWKGRAGTNFASGDAYAEFFRDLCERFHAAGRLQLLVMSAAGVDVAWKVNLIAGDVVYCFKIAYDEEYARFSPGVQLELENVEIFHGTPAAWSDSCADSDNEMINRLWPDRRAIATVLVPTGGVLGATSKHTARAVMALRRRMRRTDEQAA
ncbi:MAG: hypothetical protein QOJ07_2800 [Thermoleophilaceae bacterium]|jgi:CelD/BcsL family acetyltransferase involved in cellulose biosynthesis|nr:hypothetical protein [Thermoleophilaceae bacterium]